MQAIAEEYAAAAFAKPQDYFNVKTGLLKPLKSISLRARKAIKSIEQSKYGPKLILCDKQEALRALVDLRGDRPATRSELSGSLHLDTPGVLTPEEQAARVAELLRSELAKSTGGV